MGMFSFITKPLSKLFNSQGFGVLGNVAKVVGPIAGFIAAKHANKRNAASAMSMYNTMQQNNLDNWNLQNAYNHPKMQMARLKEAGLNPMLVYGHGSVVGNTAGAIPQVSGETPTYRAPELDFGGLTNGIMNRQQIKANDAHIALMQAQTALALANAEGAKARAMSLLDRSPENLKYVESKSPTEWLTREVLNPISRFIRDSWDEAKSGAKDTYHGFVRVHDAITRHSPIRSLFRRLGF